MKLSMTTVAWLAYGSLGLPSPKCYHSYTPQPQLICRVTDQLSRNSEIPPFPLGSRTFSDDLMLI